MQLDDELAQQLSALGVGLTTYEARRIVELIGRDPTLCELHIFNVEWSEHCSYKSSKSTLAEFLPTEAPNVILGPQEDAGIVFLTERWGIVVAHESHNHPSQVLPNEGAATGIGGIVRDVDCMGADVIATADPLRFGDPTGDNAERTRWVVRGVVEGIWQYGNALGVPNLAGESSPKTASSTRRCPRKRHASRMTSSSSASPPTTLASAARPSPPRSFRTRKRARIAAPSKCRTRSSRTCC